jgi:YD repeat-containing protein
VYQRYNPAKSASASSTDGATTFTLDALGRVTKATNPDNSFVATVYGVQTSQTSTVRTITVTDEAGVSRTMQYDGLGRMVAATEASGSTSYSYDALDNLTGVTQGSQTRSFAYDSLKRLKEAHNPETTDQTHDQSLQFISYTYDKAGNLASRSDGRFTICHGSIVSGKCDGLGYDALNRLILVTYSDPNTPTVTHCYDGLTVSATTCAGAAGNGQWMRQTWSGTIAGGAPRNFTSYSFDPAGRLIASQQTTAGAPSSPFSYSYYNDDRLASITYPSGRTVVTCYDYNGRPVWVSGSRSTADCTSGAALNTPAYAAVTGYTPSGGILSMGLGNGLTETTAYNSRLQPTQVQAGSLLTIGYDYTSPQAVCASQPNAPAYPNNGNVRRQTIARGASSWAQSYCYDDGLNRLTMGGGVGFRIVVADLRI